MSPDQAPIENIWAELNACVYARQPPPNNVQRLRHALIREWNNIHQNLFANEIGPHETQMSCLYSGQLHEIVLIYFNKNFNSMSVRCQCNGIKSLFIISFI